MQYESLPDRVRERYDGLQSHESYGEHTLFYNPDGRLAKGAYFLTVKTVDGPNDQVSDLRREGVYRVNFPILARDVPGAVRCSTDASPEERRGGHRP